MYNTYGRCRQLCIAISRHHQWNVFGRRRRPRIIIFIFHIIYKILCLCRFHSFGFFVWVLKRWRRSLAPPVSPWLLFVQTTFARRFRSLAFSLFNHLSQWAFSCLINFTPAAHATVRENAFTWPFTGRRRTHCSGMHAEGNVRDQAGVGCRHCRDTHPHPLPPPCSYCMYACLPAWLAVPMLRMLRIYVFKIPFDVAEKMGSDIIMCGTPFSPSHRIGVVNAIK